MPFPKLDKYKIQRKICKKYGFTLYDAVDKVDEKRRYLKILDEKLASDPLNVYHFFSSARRISLLKNAYLPQIYFYGKEQDYYLVVSEALTLKPLSLLIHEEFPLPLDRVIDIILKIAKPLRHLHLYGLVHGMLNPGSIYLDENGTVKIDDFGYAWLIPQLFQMADAEAAYLSYHLAPETFQDNPKLDGRTDIYSLGIIFLQLLTDYIPFNHLDSEVPKNTRFSVTRRTLEQILPGYPKQLQTILLRFLDKNPENRFLNLREIEKELKILKTENHSISDSEKVVVSNN